MKNKIFTLFVAILACTSLWAQTASGTCGPNLTWSLNNSVLTISGSGEMTNYQNYSKVPWYQYRSSINIVVIGNSVTSIGDYAFYNCSSLTSVTIPNSVTSIGNSAFQNCYGLTSPVYNAHIFAYLPTSYSGAYTIPVGIEQVAAGAFYNCVGLTSIIIPSSVISISDYAFQNCSGLASITIPNSVTSIGNWAFRSCSSLASITIPNSVTSIGIGVFAHCSGLTSIVVESGNPVYDSRDNCNAIIETTTNTLIAGFLNTIIPNSVTSIGVSAFFNCSGLTLTTIPNSVTSIGESAFYNCSVLTSITIPNSVTSIGNSAFSGCSGLTSVTIGNSVTSIGDGAFRGCSGLINISIPYSVISIGNGAFEGCSGLTSVTIGNSVTSIGNRTFYGCSSLTSVTIGNSVTSIGQSAFSGCSSLDTITCYATTPPRIGTNAFADVPDSTIVYVLLSALTDYQNNRYWGRFDIRGFASGTCGDNLTWLLADRVLTISGSGDMTNYYSESYVPWYQYRSYNYITSVIVGDSVTSIGAWAFCDCSNLTSVAISNSVIAIGGRAFSGCYALASITIPNTVTSIGNFAFNNCSGLTSITIPDSLTSIGYSAFSGCCGMTSVAIPSSVTSIGEYAFGSCSGLTSVIIPNSVTSIGEGAFEFCSGLTSVNIPDSITSISNNVFRGCAGMTSITIPNSVTSIGNSAFSGCSGLTSVTIGNSVTSIGEGAFGYCYGLSSVNMMPTTPPTLGYDAFIGNANRRVFLLNGCSYDNYYTTSTSNPWYEYRNDLREPVVNISINVLSNNTQFGIVGIQQQRGHDVRCDSTAVIYATANEYYHFGHWSNGSTANPDTIKLTGDSIVTAYFEHNSYSVSVSINDVLHGSVVYPYGNNAFYGDTLAVVAQHAEHYHVASWSGDGIISTSADKDTIWLSMTANRELLCTIAIDTLTVEVDYDFIRGNVSGEGEYAYGTPCTLVALAYTGYIFSGWSNGITANPYIFAVIENTKLTAFFESESGSGIDEVTSSNLKPQKVWSNGHLYILMPNGTRFDVTGRRVE